MGSPKLLFFDSRSLQSRVCRSSSGVPTMAHRGLATLGNHRLARAAVPALAVFSCLVGLAGVWSAQSPPPSKSGSSAIAAPRLIVSPDPIALGILAPGRSAQPVATLRNPYPEAIAVARVETSCPCLRASVTPSRIGPEGSGTLALVFDPSTEPEFRGELAIEVIGYAKGGRDVLRTKVRLEVRSGAAEDSAGRHHE